MSSSAVIQDLTPLYEEGSISLAYFYCDFRDPARRSVQNAIFSLMIQLASQSNDCRGVLQELYSIHGNGAQKPGLSVLLKCLADMVSCPPRPQGTTYIIVDALDECLSTDPQGVRDSVQLIQALVRLGRKDLRIFATNLHEDDIHNALQPLASQTVSLHENQEHLDGIVEYIKWRIQENSRMRRWRYEDRVSTWEVLSTKGAGA
jgi:hypothetical protein